MAVIPVEESDGCGIGPAFEAIGGKWKAVLLWELSEGALRYGELKRRVPGASEKMLIQQLRALEASGLIARRSFPQVPPHVEYSLTDWGRRLNEALGPVCEWGEAYARARGDRPQRSAHGGGAERHG